MPGVSLRDTDTLALPERVIVWVADGVSGGVLVALCVGVRENDSDLVVL